MQVKQLNNSSNSIETSFRSTSLTQILAIGTLAIGTSLGIAAAPAHAVALNNGSLSFTDGTSDFFANSSNSSFTVNFNNTLPAIAFVNSSTGDFLTSGFPTPGNYSINTPSATFTQVGITSNYTLNNALVFTFAAGGGTNVTVGAGSQFLRTFNGNSVAFASNGTVNTTVSNSFGTVNTSSFNLALNDTSATGAGGYSVLLSTSTPPPTAVPEPFTIIGTLVGGTAAVRMRKKLAATQK